MHLLPCILQLATSGVSAIVLVLLLLLLENDYTKYEYLLFYDVKISILDSKYKQHLTNRSRM